MAQIPLYATTADYLSLQSSFFGEDVWISPASIHTPRAERIPSIGRIPKIGIAGRPFAFERYVVYPRTVRLRAEPLGEGHFVLDQRLNDDIIFFWPGGRWKREAIIEGSFSTISRSEASQRLFRAARRSLAKTFAKFGRHYVGKEAFSLFQHGYRLTQATQSPRAGDFRLDDG